MYANNLEVNDYEMEYAEKILLGDKGVFDDDRRNYIKNLDTLDLHAVPGSGKTTLLLAKLLILEKKLPLKNDQGVLVLSHTNTAVDEIKYKIGIHCPKLFTYPNFIGTIQSFVNEFLAIPYFEDKMKKKIISIDEELYYKKINEFYINTQNYSLKKWIDQKHDPIKFLQNIRFDVSFNLISGMNEISSDFELKDKDSSSYKGLRSMKSGLLNKGMLHYDDAYNLAFKYIIDRPFIIEILNCRFKYVFVDEMQDMDIHQYNLLELLFSCIGKNVSIYQRIGDNNQAIYYKLNKSENVWKNRDIVVTINGSNRLTPINALLVSRFALDGVEVEGLNHKDNNIKPILYIFQKEKCKCNVIERYAKDIAEIYNAVSGNPVIKVISWRKKGDEEHKTSLSSYCPKYSDLKNDKSVVGILEVCHSNSFSIACNFIIEYIVSTLRTNDVFLNNEVITKSCYYKYLEENDEFNITDFRLKQYFWCLQLFKDDLTVINSINTYILEFTKRVSENSIIFKECGNFKKNNISEDECTRCKVFGKRIEVCSAHSVKGQTHDATLFLESFYDGKFESDILAEVINGRKVYDLISDKTKEIEELKKEIEKLNGNKGTKTRLLKVSKLLKDISKIKEYTKLVFVGLSRAKGVVAYGMSKDKFDQYKKVGIEELWDVREIK